MDGEGKGDTAEPETVQEKPAPEKKRKENQSDEASASDNFLVSSDDQCDGSSDGNVTVGEEQSTKKSPHTLANLNLKVKKGKESIQTKIELFNHFPYTSIAYSSTIYNMNV
jgi:hypothetical protein